METGFHLPEVVGAVAALLLIAAATLAFTKRIDQPFSVGLVVVGVALGVLLDYGPESLAPFSQYGVSPEIILFVFLPTLLFESAFNLDARQLRQNLLPVLTLAIPGVLLSTGIIGLIIWLVTPLDLPAALLLGSILSATDPVAVVALFRKLGAPLRLTVLVEGESLFNDATAIVLARILLGIAAGGYVFSPAQAFLSIGTFLGVFLGGALVGWILALAFGWLLGRVETDPFIEISLTTVLAYASFLIAEEVFHVSGVMATVAAGLTIGGWGRAKISAAVSEYLDSFWEYLAFVANALIFLLVGLRVDLGALVGSLDILAWVILAMLISRAVVTFGLIPLAGRLPNAEKITVPYQAVMYWGGLRGAIGLALALSLGDFPQAEIFVAVVMGVVLFTLVVQGLTVGMLVHWLGLDRLQLEDKVARTEGMLSAKHRAAARIPGLQKGGLFSARIGEKIEARLGNGIDDLESDLKNLRRGEFDRDQERRLLMGRVFLAEKQIYYDLFTKGHFSEPSYRELCLSVDTQIAVLRNDGKLPGTTLWSFWSRPIRIMAAGATSRLPLLGALADRIRRFYIIIDYEEDWGRYQGSTGVLEDLDNFAFAESTPADLVAEVRVLYEGWRDSARGRIDGLAEQFPEFVDAMQERLAERLVILAEREIIEAQVQSGSIPQAVAEAMLKELAAESRSLRGSDTKHLRIEPSELLRKVPFFADTPAAEVDRVIKPLRLLTVPAGQSLIVEGSKDRSLYLIARGVVRVSKNSGGGSQDVATLIAGDFFGEMALLRGVARTATCRAVTPCAVYKLSRKDFDRVRTTCPTVQAALEAVDLQRRSGLV